MPTTHKHEDWGEEEEGRWWPHDLEESEGAQPPTRSQGLVSPGSQEKEISLPSEPPGRAERAGPKGDPPLAGDGIMESLGAPLVPRRRRGRRTIRKQDKLGRPQLDGRQRLLLLDAWLRSKLPAKDFAALVGVSQHTLYKWKKLFQDEGPAGLANKPKGRSETKGASRLPEATQRAILMLKEAHPEWGQDRIHHVLARSDGFSASPGAIGRVLAGAGYEVEEGPTRPHPDKPRRFERSRPNELWQTDLFTFVLKREGRRVHLVAYMDDHSRFIVGFGLHASSSGALVREVLEASIANFGAPREILTDNGAQYHTWRGKSAFKDLCQRRGIRQIVARPRRPQTLGKIERFWGTLWRECVQSAIFRGIDDARLRIGHFVDHYNFQRTHSGIGGHVPADRYFEASEDVRRTLEARVQANALDLARHGEPRKPFYLTGRVGNAGISLHSEGERVVLVRGDGTREEVDLTATGRRADPERDEEDEAESPHVSSSEAKATGGPDQREESSPAMTDSSPPDPDWTDDDGVEMGPGQSPLDGILSELADKWHENDTPPGSSPSEKGGDR